MPTTPTPEEIQREQERLELIQKQNTAAKELASTYEKMAKTSKSLTDEEKEILDISKKIAKAATETEKSTNKRLDETSSVKDLNKSIQALQFFQLKNADIANKLEKAKIDAINESLSARVREIKYNEKIASELDKQQEIQDRIEEIKRAEGSLDKAALAAAREELKGSKAALDIHEKNLKKTIETKDQQRNLAIQLDDAAKAHQTIIKEQEEELRLANEILKVKRRDEFLNEINERFNYKKIKDTFTLLGLLKLILDAAMAFNKASVEIGKNYGYGADQADRLAQNLQSIAFNSENINVTFANAVEAMNQLNEATGFVAEYSKDALETQIMLTKQFKLTGEEAAGVYKLSVLNRKESAQIVKEMDKAFVASRNSLGVGIPYRATMAEAAKVSGRLAANLQQNPIAIVKAVAQAKALGTTLEQTAKQGETLLNWEQSIDDELKAELLTGKELNLERARAAALTGDNITLAQELAKNVGTESEFRKLNVLQQNSLAAAVGLTADELANQLRQQELAIASGKSLAQIQEEDLDNAKKRQDVQDKFNAAILKVQDIIGNLVAGPFGMLLDVLSQALNIIFVILKPFQLLYNLTSWISQTLFGWIPALGIAGKAMKGIAGAAIVWAAYKAYGAFAGNPILGLIPGLGPSLGAIAAAAVTSAGFGLLNAQKVGDLSMSPGEGPIVSTQEGGIFQGTKNDQVAMFPGAVDMAKGQGGNSQIDLSPMIVAINSVKTAIDRLYDKAWTIDMDSRNVSSVLIEKTTKPV
jgi:hypothetical protein